MLYVQYRMHPAIGDIHSKAFYNGTVKNGEKIDGFYASHNNGALAKYSPFTFVDTLKAENSYEGDKGDWKYINTLE